MRGLVHLHEHTVVHLQQPQHLQDMPRLRVDAVDAPKAHHEEHLLLGLNVEGTRLPRGTLHRRKLLLLLPVLLHVLLRTQPAFRAARFIVASCCSCSLYSFTYCSARNPPSARHASSSQAAAPAPCTPSRTAPHATRLP